MSIQRTLLLVMLTAPATWGWAPTAITLSRPRTTQKLVLFSSGEDLEDFEQIERTSFDQAGASLIEEEDQKRMEQMGDFDSNDSVRRSFVLRVVWQR